MSNQLPSSSSSPSPILYATTSCNPYFCDGNHPRPLSADQFEEKAKIFLTKSRSYFLLLGMSRSEWSGSKVVGILASYISSLVSSDLDSEENQAALNKSRIEFKDLLMDMDTNTFLFSFLLYMKEMNLCLATMDSPCIFSWSDFNEFWDGFSIASIPINFFGNVVENSFDILKKKGWTPSSIKSVGKNLLISLSLALHHSMSGTPIQGWFDYIDKMKPSQLLQYAEITNLYFHWDQTKEHKNSNTVGLPFQYTMIFFWMWQGQNFDGARVELDVELFKTMGDEKAKSKEYDLALECYSYLNCVGFDDTSPVLRLQSLLNSAALRLRIFEEDARHLPYAILEGTLALKIDSNHVKALFRRGLALALCKKWNEAIVDFERAVELDPNSPAKKELEVARRRVTRRIGN